MKNSKDVAKTGAKMAGVGLFGFLIEIGGIILMAFLVVVPVRYFIIQPFIVKGASMQPNFYDGEYLIVNEIGWRVKEAERGEVIVFKNPRNNGEYFIKRIIGLPDERIVIKGGVIKIYNDQYPNGFLLDETNYLPDSRVTSGNIDETLGEDEYFVLGDNRGASSDSRYWGPLPEKLVVGKTWIRVLPFSRMEIFQDNLSIN
ncbi:MAG: signal peptidase I [Candidatus Moranbacteria bacterium]|nr:signal peptidase I [Candidatus Moranbacteria bacterium]